MDLQTIIQNLKQQIPEARTGIDKQTMDEIRRKHAALQRKLSHLTEAILITRLKETYKVNGGANI